MKKLITMILALVAARTAALATGNMLGDHGPLLNGGCTVMAKRNSKGEVILGRNTDLDISQNPAYLYRTTFGKYQNFCIAHMPDYYKTYAEVQEADDLDQAFKDFLLTVACDCMNEKGLYVEMNLHEKFRQCQLGFIPMDYSFALKTRL